MKLRDFEDFTNKFVKDEIMKAQLVFLSSVFKIYVRNIKKVCKGERL